tara:strand:- start:97 stop:363 length:267 start_codon:yes stop_codon:yes gene_type:complete
MFSPEEKVKILCQFRDGFAAYKKELAEGYDKDENFWYGFYIKIGEAWKVFDLRFCQIDGEILCTAYRCNGPDENDDYHTDATNGWCLI